MGALRSGVGGGLRGLLRGNRVGRTLMGVVPWEHLVAWLAAVDLERALKLVHGWVQHAPDWALGQALWGDLLFRSGRLAEALEAYRAYLLAHPHDRRRYRGWASRRSEEHTSELQSRENLVCRLLLEKKNRKR